VLKPHLFVRGVRGPLFHGSFFHVIFTLPSCARLGGRGRPPLPGSCWWIRPGGEERPPHTGLVSADISGLRMWYSALKSAWRFQIDE